VVTLEVLDSAAESHYLSGGGHRLNGAADVLLEFDIDIPYDTDYALRFSLDLESHAQVPEPSSMVLWALPFAVMAMAPRRAGKSRWGCYRSRMR
jgi:hypothetical protein